VTEAAESFRLDVDPSEQGPRSYGLEGQYRDLLAAILNKAVSDFYLAQEVRDRRSARQWVYDDEAPGPTSFHSICVVLGIDVGTLRRGLAHVRIKKVLHARPVRSQQ